MSHARRGPKNHFYGKSHTLKTRNKISVTKKRNHQIKRLLTALTKFEKEKLLRSTAK